MKKGPITATFIDEITYDIPSSNWSQEDWKNDLDNMKSVGIDTVVFIRGGFEDKTIFPSRVIGTSGTPDFAGFILEESEKRDISVFFGLYVTNLEWNCGDWLNEIKINRAFIDEVWERYGDCPAFKGWYIPQECERERLNFSEILRGLSALCKDKAPDKKVLISPFFCTSVTSDNGGFSPRQTFANMPIETEEAATVDGAGTVRTFTSIMVPAASNSAITVALFSFVWQWNDRFYSGIYLKEKTLSMAYAGIRQETALTVNPKFISYNFNNQTIQAAFKGTGVLLILIPLILLFLVLQRYFVDSIENSGITG